MEKKSSDIIILLQLVYFGYESKILWQVVEKNH